MDGSFKTVGLLYRNLGDHFRIVADEVEFEQINDLTEDGIVRGWWFSASTTINVPETAPNVPDYRLAFETGQQRTDLIINSMSLIGRDDKPNAPLLSVNYHELKPDRMLGATFLRERMKLGNSPISDSALFEDKLMHVVTLLRLASPNVRLAAHWYVSALREDDATDLFMKLWVAFDVLVPLNPSSKDPFRDFKSRAIRYLRSIYGDDSRRKTFLRLYAVRKKAFHEGDLTAVREPEENAALNLVHETLTRALGL
jgi:hypothetical protein